MKRLLVLPALLALCAAPTACSNKNTPASPSNGSSLSTDGTNWIFSTLNATSTGRDGHTSLVFNDKMWVIGGNSPYGYLADTWFSSDGANWSQASDGSSASPFPAREFHSSVVFNSRMWVIGGYDGSVLNDAWSSLDGLHWNQATSGASNSFTARCNHTSLVYNNRIWVIDGDTDPTGNGSDLNDVWSSSDGVTWTRATASAAFPVRDGQTSLVFNNRMWVIGGVQGALQGSAYLNDVWSSTDGVNWVQAAANGSSSSFTPRGFHSSVVFDGALWVIGGLNSTGYLNDAWYSSDGSGWVQARVQQYFLPRALHTSLVFNNAMWVLGGISSGSFLDDAWHSP